MKEDTKTVAGTEDKSSATSGSSGIRDTSGYSQKRSKPIPTVRETKGGRPS